MCPKCTIAKWYDWRMTRKRDTENPKDTRFNWRVRSSLREKLEVIAAIEMNLPIYAARQTFKLHWGRSPIFDLEADIFRAAWRRMECSPKDALAEIGVVFNIPISRIEIHGVSPPPRDHFAEELEEIKKLQAAKRSDYTAGSVDPLANYRFSSNMVGFDVVSGMFMRLCEKMYRVKSVMEKERATADICGIPEPPVVTDESLADTFRDIAIISILCRLALTEGTPHHETYA